MATTISANPSSQTRMTDELKRQNRFWVSFTDNSSLLGNEKQAAIIENAVKASARPQFQVSEQTIHHLNTPWYIAGKPTWSTWSCTFYDFETDNTLQALYRWYSKVYNIASGVMSKPADYKRNVTLYILDASLNPNNWTDKYILWNCWPVTLDTGTLSMDSDGTPLEVAVTFRFDYVEFSSRSLAKYGASNLVGPSPSQTILA